MNPPDRPPLERETDLARLLLLAWKAKRHAEHPDQLLAKQLELGLDQA